MTGSQPERREARLLEAIGLDEPWAFIQRCASLTRLSGSDDERLAVDYLRQHLASWGISHTLHEPELFISWPGPAVVSVALPDREARSFAAKTPAMAVATGPVALTATAAYVPGAFARGVDDLFAAGLAGTGAELAGRIVLTEGLPMPAKVAELTAAGAVGAVFISPGERIHEGICTPIWGSPDLETNHRQPSIPVAAVSRGDGGVLIEAIARGGGLATLSLTTALETGWRPIPVLVAEIPGTDEADRFVLLHGHLDSWHVGIGDNSTGDATLLELARVFAHQRSRRSLRIAWWSGHSHGRYAGSTWYADTFALDLLDGCVAQLNCDSPGCRWASTFDHLSATEESWPLAEAAIRDVTGIQATWERPPRAGDYSFMNLGLSAAFMLSSTMAEEDRAVKGYYAVGGCGGNIAWHTEDDTLQIAGRETLLRDMRVYAAAVSRLLNDQVLPLDFRQTVASLGETLERYHLAAGARFDFGPARAALVMLSEALDRFYATLPVNGESAAVTGRQRNGALLALSRLLVPINYARAGRFAQDPALDVPPLPDLAPALRLPRLAPDSHEDRITRQSLVRGQNRVIWTLREATAVANRAMA